MDERWLDESTVLSYFSSPCTVWDRHSLLSIVPDRNHDISLLSPSQILALHLFVPREKMQIQGKCRPSNIMYCLFRYFRDVHVLHTLGLEGRSAIAFYANSCIHWGRGMLLSLILTGKQNNAGLSVCLWGMRSIEQGTQRLFVLGLCSASVCLLPTSVYF